jgi:hypothetical protein
MTCSISEGGKVGISVTPIVFRVLDEMPRGTRKSVEVRIKIRKRPVLGKPVLEVLASMCP